MVQQYFQYDRLQDEDPNIHLANFLEICDTFKINGVVHILFEEQGKIVVESISTGFHHHLGSND
ncbi:protein kinase 2B, chloroplastic-like [Gossypium australe]|uniref:Protein kinase 2B, chloroplastic-like n=1 Tax=Gossypium australe TaxID=47621 RepID=A0A5B6USS8_9ROSI|nr:protein kinase 2B, chloroplastic-like [Gossypium australe]